MQKAVSILLFECVLHVSEVGSSVHGPREALSGGQRSQEGNCFQYAASQFRLVPKTEVQYTSNYESRTYLHVV